MSQEAVNASGGAAAAPSGRITPRAVVTPGAASSCCSPHRSVEHCGSAAKGARPCPHPRCQQNRGMADHCPSTRLQPPFVCCIRLFDRPLHTAPHCCRQQTVHCAGSYAQSTQGAPPTPPWRAWHGAPLELIAPATLRRPTLKKPRERTTAQLRGDEHRTYSATPVGRGTGRYSRDTRDRAWMGCSRQARTNLWGAAAAPSGRVTPRAVSRPGAASACCSPTVGRTLGISCEAAVWTGLVSCIRLIDGF
jgi:hypothetical protein